MARVVPCWISGMPQYFDLINDSVKPKETPQEATTRLINIINKANGGDDL